MVKYAADVQTPSRAESSERDAGVTLVELLIYMILFSLIVTMIASTFISGKRVEKNVAAVTRASNETQLILGELEWAARNSATLKVAATDFGGDLLVVKTRKDGGTDNSNPDSWRCVAWYYDELTKTIYTKRGPATGTPVTSALSSGFSLADWTPKLMRVERSDNGGSQAPIFAPTGIGGGVILQFDTTTNYDKAPVAIDTTIIPRVQGPIAEIGGVGCGIYQ